MTIEQKITILKDQLHRFKVTKSCCDSCIPQELIDSHIEIIKDLEQLEKLKKDLQYLQDKGVTIFMFPRGRIIFGFDITNCPSEVETKKKILENAMNNMMEVFNGGK